MHTPLILTTFYVTPKQNTSYFMNGLWVVLSLNLC